MSASAVAGAPLPITLFADFSCPFSFVTEAGLRRMAREGIALIPRAFELYPEPEPLPLPSLPAGDWEPLQGLATDAGVVLRQAEFRPRTRKAHEAARFAREQGREPELRAAIFAAYWSQGLDIGRVDVLVELAQGIGLDGEDLKITLDIDQFLPHVQRDEDVARRLGITSTPTLFIGSGATAKVIIGAPAPDELRLLIDEQIRTRSNEPGNG